MSNLEKGNSKSEAMFLPVENATHGGFSDVCEPRFLKRIGERVIIHKDAINFYGRCLSKYLLNAVYKYTNTATLEDVLRTADEFDIGKAVDNNLT